MFKLKKLELLGFKSFADRTRLEFSDGTAAVVGPNGCGKSNLSDAISWVLGEQSARLLRGERMADVIFNGTGTRPPTGMAEVSLALVDPEYERAGEEPGFGVRDSGAGEQLEAESPSDSNRTGAGKHESAAASPGSRIPNPVVGRAGEILVTRRLFRSGESEYLINGQVCRLRDIQDLFMGTGLGPESYAIIEQGRIGQILSSKPADRRAIIEEAAGVSKFKTRKRLAEVKLESSRQNLARITDILEEVSKQVGSLKRQASRARRYREVQEEVKARSKTVLTSRLMVLEAEWLRLREECAGIAAESLKAAARLEDLEREQKSAARQHEQQEEALARLRERIAQGDLEKERLESRLVQARQQSANFDTRAADARRERLEVEARLVVLEQQCSERAQQAVELRRDFADAQAAAHDFLASQEALARNVEETEEEIDDARQAGLTVASHASELRNLLIQVQETGLALDRQAARAEAERAAVDEEHRRGTGELEVCLDEHRSCTGALEALAQSASAIAAQLHEARAEEARRRDDLESLRQEYSAAAARRQTLEETLARHTYTPDSVRRLLAGNVPANGHAFRPLGLLADFVEVSHGYEDVVEEFLQRELECVVVEQHEEARSGIALLRSESTGRSGFFVTRIATNGHGNGNAEGHDLKIRSEPGVTGRMRDVVRFEARLGLNDDVVLPSLENAYLVEDVRVAERLAGAYPECHFLTPAGEHYHHRLVSGGKGASAGPLGLRRDLRELERRTSELELRLRTDEFALAEVTTRAVRKDEALRGASAAKLETEKKAVVASEKLRQAQENLDRTAERLRVFAGEAVVIAEERQAMGARQSDLSLELQAAAAEQSRREQQIIYAANTLRELRARLDALVEDLVGAQARASALEERTRGLEAEQGRLEVERQDLRERVHRHTEQIESWLAEQQQLAAAAENFSIQLSDLDAAQKDSREQCRILEEESRAFRARRDELGPRVEEARVGLDACRQKRSVSEIALARLESDRAHHFSLCRDELHTEPGVLLAELGPELVLAGEALAAAEGALRELKARLESLGPVNMMALEELEEAEGRFTFLETQRQDLLSSIENTAQAIREIDAVSRQQFLEAFKAINAYFAESFRTLFGGGTGEMRLSDDADPDSGLDIVAQPPGKRLQNVLLLSGGEKALAALALLIAVFRYTPSPFCILDEVDAPLDESNVDRFTRMIGNMSCHTQFILITHNKRTMEMAQVMYGVTMEEPGVSKLVSVRFDAAEQESVAVAV
jgi:chromosome segregation protein